MNKVELVNALTTTLVANDAVAQSVFEQAERLHVNPYELQNPDGTYPMITILNTRANILLAMTTLRLS